MNHRYTLLLLSTVLQVCACTPHPGAGVWRTAQDNSHGIAEIIVSYDGKAQFETSKGDVATWHCFWGASGKHQASLECSASTNPEHVENFLLTINPQGFAELQHESQLIGIFERQDENPSIQ